MLWSFVWITRHGMERQWLNGFSVCSIRIGILGPSIHEQQEITRPASLQLWQVLGVIQQTDLISRTHNDHPVVHALHKTTDVPVARIEAPNRIPHRGRRPFLVFKSF